MVNAINFLCILPNRLLQRAGRHERLGHQGSPYVASAFLSFAGCSPIPLECSGWALALGMDLAASMASVWLKAFDEPALAILQCTGDGTRPWPLLAKLPVDQLGKADAPSAGLGGA